MHSNRRAFLFPGFLPLIFNFLRKNSSLFFIFLASTSCAQFYQLKNYNVKDGLPSSEVYSMMQDAQGYMWFTTDMGVSRFNGYEFKNFSTENGLADNTVFGLTQDGKGRMWFRSFS
jgi:ligand-binding sensor domain-containing protein